MIGIVIGLSSAPSAVYSVEIAHPTLRGRFSVITSVTIAMGVLVIYVLGYFIPVRLNRLFYSLSRLRFFSSSFTFRCNLAGKLAYGERNKLWYFVGFTDFIGANTGNTDVAGLERANRQS